MGFAWIFPKSRRAELGRQLWPWGRDSQTLKTSNELVDNIIRSLIDKATLARDKWKFAEINKPAKSLCV